MLNKDISRVVKATDERTGPAGKLQLRLQPPGPEGRAMQILSRKALQAKRVCPAPSTGGSGTATHTQSYLETHAAASAAKGAPR